MSWNKKLREWIEYQEISQQKFADLLNKNQKKKISRNTVNDWIRGKATHIVKDSKYRISRLYEVTKLDCFAPEKVESTKTTKPESIDGLLTNFQNIEKEFKNLRSEIAKNTKTYDLLKENKPVSERANNVSNLFYMLIEELDFFKNSNEKERKQLTEKISPQDVGYLTSFLNAIYRPKDQFRSWVFSSNYKQEK
jgi:transcriptional regulator with XRE-family HTH domain